MDDCLIWEACRATSAAPTFSSYKYRKTPSCICPQRSGYNNPIRSLWEVGHIWPQRKAACIISIGTGVPTSINVERTVKSLLTTLTARSADTEKVAREYREDMKSR